jgi:hypothetical protein
MVPSEPFARHPEPPDCGLITLAFGFRDRHNIGQTAISFRILPHPSAKLVASSLLWARKSSSGLCRRMAWSTSGLDPAR